MFLEQVPFDDNIYYRSSLLQTCMDGASYQTYTNDKLKYCMNLSRRFEMPEELG